MDQHSLWVQICERFREVRRLALPTVAVFVVGSCGATLARRAIALWLLVRTARLSDGMSLPGSPPVALGLGVGFLLAVPLLAWQVVALLAPVSMHAARRRFAGYLALSFIVVGGNLLQFLSRLAERERAEEAFGREYGYVPLSMLDGVDLDMSLLGGYALFTAMVVPIFAVVRHRSSAAHPAFTTAASAWCVGSLLMLGLRRLDPSETTRLEFPGLVEAGVALSIFIPILTTQRYRVLAGPSAKTLLPLLGLSGLLLAQCSLVFASNQDGIWMWTLYTVAAGSAVVGRRLCREASAV